ncbi:MAG: hypothetical protein ACTTKL_02970 [Treponema sp.]
MKTEIIPQTAALSHSFPRGTFSGGGSVFVRVIKNLGGGAYLVSLAGKKFNVKSETPLAENSTLRASVKFDGGKILLVRQAETAAEVFSAQKIMLDAGADGVLSGAAAAYLKKLGLPPDSLPFSLLSHMQELGLRFDRALLRRIYALSKKFKGREKRAAEIALALEQKGLPADDNSILALMADDGGRARGGMPEQPYENSPNDEQKENPEDDRKCAGFERAALNAFKDFFTGLLRESADAKNVKYGFTALFNHRPADKRKSDFTQTWIRLPFSFSYTQGGMDGSGTGCVNILVKTDSKSLEKASVTFSVGERRYAAAFSIDARSVGKIKLSAPEQECSGTFAAAVQSRFPAADVEMITESTDGGSEFFPAADFLYTADGSA